MRRLFVAVALLILASSSQAAITLVQHTYVASLASGGTIAYTSNTGVGNLLTITYEVNLPGLPITAVSDSSGNSGWASIGSTQINSSGQRVGIWYVANSVGGADTLTITAGSGGVREIYIQEWSGMATSSVLGGSGGNTGSGTAQSTGSFTVLNGSLVLGIAVIGGALGVPGSGFTQIDYAAGSSWVVEYQTSTSTSATVTSTSGSGPWAIIAAEFKVATTNKTTSQPFIF